jgi:uncharacterized phage-associated protein
MKMVSVFDVAQFILRECGSMTAMKLQKLVYYCQAWSLVWDEKPLFRERIEAWANGPVVRELFDYHRGQFRVNSIPKGNPEKLNARQKETVLAVLKYYCKKSSQWLSDLTHMEDPWREARRGIRENERGSQVISHASMIEYYSSLLPES